MARRAGKTTIMSRKIRTGTIEDFIKGRASTEAAFAEIRSNIPSNRQQASVITLCFSRSLSHASEETPVNREPAKILPFRPREP